MSEPVDEQVAETAPPLASVHTEGFPELLSQLGISLLVTTYQAGKLVIVRSLDGGLNTHFRSFRRPMGLAVDAERLAIGTPPEIWEFRNAPAVGRRSDERLDACFLPRRAHVTGEIQVHELAYGDDDLWLVNTRFSCLCTLDSKHSFLPRWQPPFISKLAADDRCHLNGLAMADGRPRFVTVMGQTDQPQGWRENKASGGALLDVETGETVLAGLSMPHSPRWHQGRLWLLNSGAGTLVVADVASGRSDCVAEMPGFTRGLDFHDRYAFVGLSQVRESAIFSGIEITNRLEAGERTCGVAVVDLDRGETVGLLKFANAVQEIFAVQVLPVRMPDVINDDLTLIEDSFVVPDDVMRQVDSSIAFPSAGQEQ